jgi:hypothetical protein
VICSPPPEGGSSNDLADWLELEVLTSPKNSAPTNAINQALEIAEDDEPEKLDEENILTERRLQQVISAVQERTTTIGASYPFELDNTGSTLKLREAMTPGSYAYLFCLIVSSAAPNGLLAGEGPWTPNIQEARVLFQLCATIASAGRANGPAYSVGWPRPDSSGFLQKLKIVYSHFGDGKPHDEVPPGAPTHVKDGGIDVIAWMHTNDATPPLGYFLGQAASGANWPDKSLLGIAASYHKVWFSKMPASTPLLATIMPFNLPSPADAEAADHEAQDVIEGNLYTTVSIHGEVLHRHRVARFAEKGLELHASSIGPIEGASDFSLVVTYVNNYRAQLQAAASSTT